MYNLEQNKNNDLFSFFDDMMDDMFCRDLKTDIYEDNDSYNLEIEIPGVKKENIKLELEDDTLTVNVNNESNNNKKEYLKKERVFMNMTRKYYLENSNPEGIKATLNDGILNIRIEKVKPQTEPKKLITIE